MRAVVVAIVLSLVGCAALDPECVVVESQHNAIKLAEPDAGASIVPAAAALVAVHWQDASDESAPELKCTATRIADAVYLTARHCVPSATAGRRVLLSSSVLSTDLTSACDSSWEESAEQVIQIEPHESLDLALLVVDRSFTGASTQRMALSLVRPNPGTHARIAGFGLTEDATVGELRGIDARVQSTSRNSIVVQGVGGGACVGDSGGPLYSVDAGDARSQPATLLGVLSRGSPSCLGKDEYLDVSLVNDWIEATLPPQ